MTSTESLGTLRPLYSPSLTSGITMTSALKVSGLSSAGISSPTSMSGLSTASSPRSTIACTNQRLMADSTASARMASSPSFCCTMVTGALPGRNPGMRTSRTSLAQLDVVGFLDLFRRDLDLDLYLVAVALFEGGPHIYPFLALDPVRPSAGERTRTSTSKDTCS